MTQKQDETITRFADGAYAEKQQDYLQRFLQAYLDGFQNGFWIGVEQGFRQGVKATLVALDLLSKGTPVATIAKETKLSEDHIRQLQSKMTK